MLRKLSYISLICYIFLLNSCKFRDDDKDDITLGFSQCIDNDIWRKSMDHSMEVEASLHPEVRLTIYNANRNVKKQIDDIEKFIDDSVDVIIISPYESDSIVPVIEKAFAKGIPVVIIDRKVNTTNYSAYIGADNIEVGRIAGKHIISTSKGVANVIEIKGGGLTSPVYERSLGFNQIVKQYPTIKVTSVTVDEYGRPKSDFKNLLNLNATIDYVFCFNDIISYNAWKIAKTKGLEKKNKVYRC